MVKLSKHASDAARLWMSGLVGIVLAGCGGSTPPPPPSATATTTVTVPANNVGAMASPQSPQAGHAAASSMPGTPPAGTPPNGASATVGAHSQAPAGATPVQAHTAATAPTAAGHAQASASSNPASTPVVVTTPATAAHAPAPAAATPTNAPAAAVNPAAAGRAQAPVGANSAVAGGTGAQGGTQFPAGSAEDTLLKFCTAMSEGNVTAAAELVSPKARSLLAQIRDGELPDDKIDELVTSFALSGLKTKPSRKTGGSEKTLNLGNEQGQFLSFTLSKEDDTYKVKEFTISKPKK